MNIKECLSTGTPYTGMNDAFDREALKSYTEKAVDASINAHKVLMDEFAASSSRITIFGDEHSNEKEKYISFKDKGGRECYGAWDPNAPATDIGVRAANPDFRGVVNPTTVVHADSLAGFDMCSRQAPKEVKEAVISVARLNYFVEQAIAVPYLGRVARAYGIDPDEYQAIFYPNGSRHKTLTRVILYHEYASEGQRPTSKDNDKELLIKEHNDQSSFTIDVEQSTEGLQYHSTKGWVDAGKEVACFRGAADDYLPKKLGETKPTFHRALLERALSDTVPEKLASAGLVRYAIPTFISPSVDGARVVCPSSEEVQTIQCH